jgi:hypothetical protein
LSLLSNNGKEVPNDVRTAFDIGKTARVMFAYTILTRCDSEPEQCVKIRQLPAGYEDVIVGDGNPSQLDSESTGPSLIPNKSQILLSTSAAYCTSATDIFRRSSLTTGMKSLSDGNRQLSARGLGRETVRKMDLLAQYVPSRFPTLMRKARVT